MRRWLLRVLGYGSLIVVTLVVTALLVIQTGWFKDRLRRFAVEWSSRYLTGQLSIGRLGGSLFRGVTLDDVSLVQNGETLLTARQITVHYDPFVLARRRVAFANIAIDRATLRVVEEDAGWNVAAIVRPLERTGPPTDFAIARITLADSEVMVVPRYQAARRLTDVDFDGRLSRQGGRLNVTLSSLTATDERSGYRVSKLEGSFSDALDALTVAFDAASGASRVSGRVTGSRTGSGRTLHVAADVAAFDLASVVGDPNWGTNVTGLATADVEMPAADGRPAMAFTFKGPHASGFGYEGRDVDATGRWAGSRVEFQARATGYGAEAAIRATWQERRFSGRGTFRNLDVRRLPRGLALPAFQTRLGGEFSVAYAPSSWNADVTLAESSLEEAALAAGTRGHLESAGGVIRYEGHGSLAGLNVRRLATPLDLAILGAERFESRLTGTFDVEGVESKAAPRMLVARATLTDSTVAGAQFDSLALTTTLTGRQLAIIANGGFEHVTGTLAGLPETVPLDATGTADVRLTFQDYSAPIDATSVHAGGWVALEPSTIRDISIREGRVAGELSSGLLTLTELNIAGDDASVTATGTLALDAGESALRVTASIADLAKIGERLERPLTGAAEIDATVTGPPDRPQATGTANLRQFGYGTTATALTLTTTFAADMPGRKLDELSVESNTDAAFVEVAGLELIRLAAKVSYARQELDVEARLEDQTRQVDIAGSVGLEAGPRQITVRQLALTTGGATWSLPAGRHARVALASDHVTVDGLRLARDRQQFDVAGSLPFEVGAHSAAMDDPGTLTVDAKDVRLADINQLLLGTRPLEGVVNGTVDVSGSLRDPIVDARMTIANGAVQGVRFDAVRARVRYANHRAAIDASLDQTANNRLTVTGSVPVGAPEGREPAAIDLRVQSTPIDLGLVQAFTAELDRVTGTGTFDLHVSGTRAAPRLNGTAALDNGAFNVVATGVRYQGLSARLHLDGQHLTIQSFQLADPHGSSLNVVGGLNVLGETAGTGLKVKITADDLQVLENASGNVRLDADLDMRGDLGALEIAGRLRVDQGRIEVDRVLETTTKSVYSTKPQEDEAAPAVEPAAAEAVVTADGAAVSPPALAPPATVTDRNAQSPGAFDRMSIAIELEVPDNLVMRGRDIRVGGGSSMGLGDVNIVAGGTLSIRKPAGESLSILGSLGILRGYYSFQGRRFDVERDSAVRFRGSDLADPALAITANREISGVDTSVNVRGSARNPEITLSSRPPLDSADIMSLIVFGQPANDLGQAERVSLAERAGTMAAGAIATPLADSVARALNLDMFEILAPAGDAKAPVVSLGSQFGTRLYVGIRQEIGEEGSALSIEYRIAEFLRLVTSVAQGALHAQTLGRAESHGIDLIFMFRY